MQHLWRALLFLLILAGPAWAASGPQTQDTNMTKVGGTPLSAANVVDAGNNAFRINCVVGCTPISSFTDASPFTIGTTVETNIGGVFNDAVTTLSSGNAAVARITPYRGLHVNLRNQSGTELATGGNPLRIDPTGSTAQPISGTVTVNGTITANQGGAPWTVRLQDGSTGTLGAVTAGNALKTDASATTQPISGNVGFVGTPGVNLAQLGGTSLTGANVVDGANTAFRINCILGCVTSGFVDQATFTIGTSTGGAMMASFNDAAANLSAGTAGVLRSTNDRMLFTNLGKVGGTAISGANVVDAGNTAFRVNCVVGCTPVSSFTDNAAFTAGTTVETNVGGVFNDGLAAVTSGNAAAARITTNRGLHANLRKNDGTELGISTAPLRTDPTGTTTQPVSGTVTANIGTTNGIALDASVNGVLVAQNSTTAAQVGPLIQGAVTTAAPSYTTAKTSPLSLTTGGLLRVDGSGATQPVSGTVSITTNSAVNVAQVGGTSVSGANVVDAGNTAFRVNCVVGCAFSAFTDNTAYTAGSSTVINVGGVFNDSITSLTSGNAGTLRLTTDRMLFTNLGKIAGVATSTGVGAAGTGTQRVVDVASGTTGAAPPTQATFNGALSSGATGGFLTGYTACDLNKPINISTATTTLMVTGVSGRQVRVCSFHMVTAGANNVAWLEGTGATCGTGTAGMAGGTTAASGYNFSANGGIAIGTGIGEVLATATTGDSVCLITSAATQLSGFIKYTIY